MRDRSIDVTRGLIVILMIYCHVLQFFADLQQYPAAEGMIQIISVLAFPTFLFLFGRTTALAYLPKSFLRALPRMIKTLLRSLCAFYVSGIGYRVLKENKPLRAATVRGVLTLGDIPGWSEFLIAFALVSLAAIALFPALRKVAKRGWLALALSIPCVLCCLIPYQRVASTRLALFIGGTQYAYFPVVQYLPYYLAGVAYAQAGRKQRLCMAAISAACTASALLYTHGALPSRFPPEWAWILLPAAGVAALTVIGHGLAAVPGWAGNAIYAGASKLGVASLYYLVGSNLVLFTLAGKNTAPVADSSVWPWTQAIQSPLGAVTWTTLLIALLTFLAVLAGRSAGASPKSAPKGR